MAITASPQGFEHSRRGSAPAAVNRRSRRVDAAGWFDWLTTPLLSKRRRAPFWLLAAVTATGTLAMHILIPVLPLAAADFSVSRRAIQQAITLYLFGIACGQLLYGPASDRFRPSRCTDPCSAMKATCSGCGCSGVPSPPSVVTLVPAAADTGSEHDRVGARSTWTVHAPHCASPQPKCGLLSPSSLRST